ncbi:hypothetical protein [Natrinema caseinilyticum]|uniref:hypothetical protein n=1 Tax=Natrinema caseinilyticum TaxID=2961570 RepID=UPI0020C50833|nr:hypothetical protein [Natrinema caseinilyticum]
MKELQAAELLSGVKTILQEAINYYNSSRFVLLRVRQNEALFTSFYERFVRQSEDPAPQIFLRGFDSEPIRAEKALFDIATWCRENPALADVLRDTPRKDVEKTLTEEIPPDSVSANVWTEWQDRFQAYLDKHGHAIYDLDILKPVPATDPSLPFDTLTWLLESEGLDPYMRQRQLSERRQQATDSVLRRLGPIRRPIFRRLLKQAQNVTSLREDILAEVGRGWPVLQQMAEEVGLRLAETGVIDQADDVYWLEWEELNEMAAALDGGRTPLNDVSETVIERKARWESRKYLIRPRLSTDV